MLPEVLSPIEPAEVRYFRLRQRTKVRAVMAGPQDGVSDSETQQGLPRRGRWWVSRSLPSGRPEAGPGGPARWQALAGPVAQPSLRREPMRAVTVDKPASAARSARCKCPRGP